MGILDNLATKIADKVNVNNDELMSLTQENEQLKRDYDAKAYTVIEIENKVSKKHDDWVNANKAIVEALKENNRLKDRYDEVKTKLEDLAESGERQVSLIADYLEQIDELKSQKSDTKLKQRCRELAEECEVQKNKADSNSVYRKTYEHISDDKNRDSVKDIFSHNLITWMNNFDYTNVKAAEKLGVSHRFIAEWKNKRTALTVNSIRTVDLVLCDYFECTVYELVTVKQGV